MFRRALSIGSIAAIGAGFAAGAAFAYFFDPQSGAKRRGRLRDEAAHLRRLVTNEIQGREHDLLNRGRGVVARVESMMRSRAAVDDDVVIERIRAKLGRVSSHPHDIEVHSHGDGRFEIFGAVLGREHAEVREAVAHVQGVKLLEDKLLDRSSDLDVIAFRGASPPDVVAHVHGPS